MAIKCHIRRNDIVVTIAGDDTGAGKTGKVLQVLPKKQVAIVEGFNLVKKHLRKSQDNPHGAIAEREAPIRISKLSLYCVECKRGVRVSRVKEAGGTIRKCKKCGHIFE